MRSLAFAALLACAGCLGVCAGCLGGDTPGGMPGTAVDAGHSGAGGSGGATAPRDLALPPPAGDGGSVADLARAPGADLAVACIATTTPPDDGHHNAGQACLGCHDGNGATRFTVAGTLYGAAGNALAGDTIEVIDAKGATARIATSQNGNFYTSQSLTPPLTTRASGCPNDTAMASKATGDCNSSGCHGSAMRIHLP